MLRNAGLGKEARCCYEFDSDRAAVLDLILRRTGARSRWVVCLGKSVEPKKEIRTVVSGVLGTEFAGVKLSRTSSFVVIVVVVVVVVVGRVVGSCTERSRARDKKRRAFGMGKVAPLDRYPVLRIDTTARQVER